MIRQEYLSMSCSESDARSPRGGRGGSEVADVILTREGGERIVAQYERPATGGSAASRVCRKSADLRPESAPRLLGPRREPAGLAPGRRALGAPPRRSHARA